MTTHVNIQDALWFTLIEEDYTGTSYCIQVKDHLSVTYATKPFDRRSLWRVTGGSIQERSLSNAQVVENLSHKDPV